MTTKCEHKEMESEIDYANYCKQCRKSELDILKEEKTRLLSMLAQLHMRVADTARLKELKDKATDEMIDTQFKNYMTLYNEYCKLRGDDNAT